MSVLAIGGENVDLFHTKYPKYVAYPTPTMAGINPLRIVNIHAEFLAAITKSSVRSTCRPNQHTQAAQNEYTTVDHNPASTPLVRSPPPNNIAKTRTKVRIRRTRIENARSSPSPNTTPPMMAATASTTHGSSTIDIGRYDCHGTHKTHTNTATCRIELLLSVHIECAMVSIPHATLIWR